MDNYSIKNWLLAIRPKTLIAGFTPVLLAGVLTGRFDLRSLLLWACCFVVALSLQIAANLINDYYDWRKQIDSHLSLGPQRVTASGLISPLFVKLGGLAFLALAAGVGLFAAWLSSWYILIPGAVCLLLAWSYTGGPLPLSYLALGEFSAFIFFGLIAGCGSYFVMTGTITLVSLLAAMQCGFYAAAIMAVNNLRDINTDLAGGKRTLAGRIGEKYARTLTLTLYMAGVFMPVLTSVVTGCWWLLGCLALLPLALKVCWSIQTKRISSRFNSYLAEVAATELISAVLFSLIWLSL
ncbi:MAG: 1,4-dihydroxy-2-naphthoate octaprenyltransferase [Sedimentisphaerales bacterium]|nr:1,4-dihydroxy-2-naphthoate octaprenyltransferase [Sedimentisphaerales bacterium]MBN2842526.1 1,4-dihydroxy-2-naphthoate octaprenyltransferase [Sedimentisphaerales bacterium]